MRFLYIFILPLMLIGCNSNAEKNEKKTLVVVSVAPYADLTEKIAGDTVTIRTVIPRGYNPHIYEGAPSQLTGLEKAKLWIGLGEPFEQHLLKSLKDKDSSLQSIDLTKYVPHLLTESHAGHSHSPDSIDRHIWLSPELLSLQANVIYESLVKILPENEALYSKRLQNLQNELSELNDNCLKLLDPIKGKAFLISHPSLGYFSKEYQLLQVPVESEGKSPLAKDVGKILKLIEKYKIHCVLTQPNFDNKPSLTIAKEKGLHVAEIDPFAADLLENILHIAQTLSECTHD